MKKLNNKGFSLVELLVVIAIMVVLVGVVAPSLLANIEKARESKDYQALDTLVGAVQACLADEDVYDAIIDATTAAGASSTVTFNLTAAYGGSAFSVGSKATSANAKLKNALGSYMPEANVYSGSNIILFGGKTAKKDGENLMVSIDTTTGKVKVALYGAAPAGGTAAVITGTSGTEYSVER